MSKAITDDSPSLSRRTEVRGCFRISDFGFRPSGLVALCCCLGVAILTGCAHSSSIQSAMPAPRPPLFLSGPMAVLLTNLDGFSAHVELQNQSLAPTSSGSGELLGRGDKFFFAPAPKSFARKEARLAGFSFIWDVSENRGYLLSEALQGYAPLSANSHFTNILSRPNGAVAKTVSGHECQAEEVSIHSSGGSTAQFEVWRANDLKAFPIRILTANPANSPALNFSNVKLEPPSLRLFQPPDGFTKYESPEGMMSEMAMRQQYMKHSHSSETPETDLDMQQRRPSR